MTPTSRTPSDASIWFGLAIGAFAGVAVAKVAIEQAFIVGLSDEERRSVMLAAACMASAVAAKQFFDIDENTVADKVVDVLVSH